MSSDRASSQKSRYSDLNPEKSRFIVNQKYTKNDDDLSIRSSSPSDDDFHSVSSQNSIGGSDEETTLLGDNIKDDDMDTSLSENNSHDLPEYLDLIPFSLWGSEPARPRSLSKISEVSHPLADQETQDDLYLSRVPFTYRDSTNLIKNGSELTLTGSEAGILDDQPDIYYDAENLSRETPQDGSPESNNIIVSGNVRKDQTETGRSDRSLSTKIHINPLIKPVALNSGEVASESTPKISDAVEFSFPHITQGRSAASHSPTSLAGQTAEVMEEPSTPLRDQKSPDLPNIVLTEATVHDSLDIPASLRNLVYLTTQDTAVPVADNIIVMNPAYLFPNEKKRSNLKKKPYTPPPTPSAYKTSATDNSSNSSSTNSLNVSGGNKKSIKWGSDLPVSRKTAASRIPSEQSSIIPQADIRVPSSPPASSNSDNLQRVILPASSLVINKPHYVNVPSEGDTTETDFRQDIQQPENTVDARDKEVAAGSGLSTPCRTSSLKEQPDNNVIARAVRALNAKSQEETDQGKASEEDGISMGVVSSCGGLSTPGDMTPKDYLTDAEDTVTSMDGFQARQNQDESSNGYSAQVRESVTSDDVFQSEGIPTSVGAISESLKNSLVVILSGIYGIALVVLGFVFPLSETFANPEHPYFFEIFYLYLYTASLVFLIYVYTYLLRNEQSFLDFLPRAISQRISRSFSRSSSVKSRTSTTSERSTSTLNRSGSSSPKKLKPRPLMRLNSNLSSISSRRRRKIGYNSEVSNHTGSFYLRVGVVGFGIGSMIHNALIFAHYFEVSHLDSHCSHAIQAIKPLSHLIFTFLQMYFVFRNSKMCVHKYKTLARFGLMHMSCTNICVWLRSVVVQTVQVIKTDRRDSYLAMVESYQQYVNEESGQQKSVQTLDEYLHEHQVASMPEINCRWDVMMGKIVESSSVYLYPCIIEYSLVCACVLYVMWSNVGGSAAPTKRPESCSDADTLNSEAENEDESHPDQRMSVDCAGSSRGLFLGILLFVLAVVCVVCFYVLVSVRSHVTAGILLGHVSEEIILLVALIATVIAAVQMRHMRYTSKRKVGIEEILTLISISGLGLYGIWSMIAAVFHQDTLHGRLTLVTNLFMLVQAGAQATFSLATLRASARNNQQLRSKPGRQSLTFLIMCNFALWMINTFETQRMEYNQTQVDFYGNTAWAIFNHISVPLGIYFRFHSTVILSIVWKKAWKRTDSREERDSPRH